MSLQFPGKPLQEGLKEFGVQVMHGVTGQGLVGGEGPFHEVLEEGLRLAVGEAEEGAVKEEGQVKGVVVAPEAAPSRAKCRQCPRTSLGLASRRTKPRLPIRREIYTREPWLCKASPRLDRYTPLGVNKGHDAARSLIPGPRPRAHNRRYPLWGLLALLSRVDSLRGVERYKIDLAA